MRRSLSDLASSRFPRTLVRPGMRRKCGMKVAEFGLGTGKPQVPAPAHEGSSGTWSSTERVFQVFGCPFCCNRGGQVIVCCLQHSSPHLGATFETLRDECPDYAAAEPDQECRPKRHLVRGCEHRRASAFAVVNPSRGEAWTSSSGSPGTPTDRCPRRSGWRCATSSPSSAASRAIRQSPVSPARLVST
jgi:hypothetical protein